MSNEEPTAAEIDAAEQKIQDAIQALANLAHTGALITGWAITATGFREDYPVTFNLSPRNQPSAYDFGLHRYGHALAEATAKTIEQQEEE